MGIGKERKALYLCSVAVCNYSGGKFSVGPRFHLPHCTPSHAELLQTLPLPGRTKWLLQRSMIPFLKTGEPGGKFPRLHGKYTQGENIWVLRVWVPFYSHPEGVGGRGHTRVLRMQTYIYIYTQDKKQGKTVSKY